MGEVGYEASELLQEFANQPEELRQVFLYAICQTMVQAGNLDFVGAFNTGGDLRTVIYRNRDTGDVFEIVKPDMSQEEEQALRARIAELLQDIAEAA